MKASEPLPYEIGKWKLENIDERPLESNNKKWEINIPLSTKNNI